MAAPGLPYRPEVGSIPTEPGVYRFFDADDRVLYVGKAKQLRARLSNYFAPLDRLHERTRRMVTNAVRVDWTIVNTEVEALQLEYTWIKEFAPPYNVQFRDDKSYPYLAVTLAEEAPRALITRNPKLRGARYFGPYPKVWAVRETLDLMLRALPIRTCNDSDYTRAMRTGKPCLAGQIGACGGPCSGKVTIEEHRHRVDAFVSFLAGGDTGVIADFEQRMRLAASEQRYEDAAMLRDTVDSLRTVLAKSSVVLSDRLDVDVFGVVHDELVAAVHLFQVRAGRIRGTRSWTVDKELELELPELVEQALQYVYDELEPAREVLIPVLPEAEQSLAQWLGMRRNGRRVLLRVAQRGEKAAIAETAARNAAETLAGYRLRRASDFTARSLALQDLQDALGLDEAPLRIECYDISHLGGTEIVGSMVVFEDGLPRKDQYRRYLIAEAADDTAAMHQVLSRRLARLDEDAPAQAAEDPNRKVRFAYRPNLLLIDGGQPQVRAAAKALSEAGASGIAVVGIAKRLEELWLPDEDYPVILPRGSEALFLLQRLRDEAHRFAITHQRARRKRGIGTVLAEIPGLGPARTAGLLKAFGSVTRLRAASAEQIAEVKGISPTLAQTIHRRLHPES